MQIGFRWQPLGLSRLMARRPLRVASNVTGR